MNKFDCNVIMTNRIYNNGSERISKNLNLITNLFNITIINIKMNELNLITYKDKRGCGNGNFGDELSEIILKFLFKKYTIPGVEIILNKSKKYNIVFIGSLIGWANNNYNNIQILGSGIRTEKDEVKKNIKIKIHSVRGPLTKKYLEKFNYHVNSIYGVPALLLPNFYNPNKILLCKNKIGVLGHLTNFHKYKNIPDNYIMINPT